MLFHFFFVALGVVLVTFGARLLVEGSSALAKRLHVSDLIIGLTVVSFGTSAPELVVSVVAAKNGTAELALGNVIGSNIVNICLILGYLLFYNRSGFKEIPFGKKFR